MDYKFYSLHWRLERDEIRNQFQLIRIQDRPNPIEDADFNDQVMKQNAELVDLNTRHTDEKMALRDQLRKLEEEVWKTQAGEEIAAGGMTDSVRVFSS